MKTNKIDKTIKQKLENRTLTPSASAWERLSMQLDEQPKKNKKGWLFYAGIAASILVLLTLGIQLFSKDDKVVSPTQELVIAPETKKEIDKKIEQLVNEIPVKEVLVNKEEVELKKEITHSPVVVNTSKQSAKKKSFIKKTDAFSENNEIIAKIDEENIPKNTSTKEKMNIEKTTVNNVLNQDPNSTIKVNADDLLYAVTHTSKEVKAYYAKHKIDRDDVLRTIKNELKKSNIKINPNTILAEVERSIDDDVFQNNFMKSLKRRVSDIASAIATRND